MFAHLLLFLYQQVVQHFQLLSSLSNPISSIIQNLSFSSQVLFSALRVSRRRSYITGRRVEVVSQKLYSLLAEMGKVFVISTLRSAFFGSKMHIRLVHVCEKCCWCGRERWIGEGTSEILRFLSGVFALLWARGVPSHTQYLVRIRLVTKTALAKQNILLLASDEGDVCGFWRFFCDFQENGVVRRVGPEFWIGARSDWGVFWMVKSSMRMLCTLSA